MNSGTTLLKAEDRFALHPVKYQWAWDMYLSDMDNHWTPREIQMAQDIATWKGSTITEAQRHTFLSVMAQLTTFDVQRGQDAAITMMGLFEAPEIGQYFQRLIDVEALHTWSYQYCIENLGLDPNDIYRRYKTVPAMAARVAYAEEVNKKLGFLQYVKLGDELQGKEFEWTHTRLRHLILGVVFWTLCFEGIWFVMSLTGPVQNTARQTGQHFQNTAEQFQYILRDEVQHVVFGNNITNTLKLEYPDVWDDKLVNLVVQMVIESVRLEDDYIDYCMPEPVLGYNAGLHKEMTRHVAARRLRAIGIEPPPVLAKATNCMPWMDEMIGHKKEINFFENKVKEYQAGGALKWNDDNPEEFPKLF